MNQPDLDSFSCYWRKTNKIVCSCTVYIPISHSLSVLGCLALKKNYFFWTRIFLGTNKFVPSCGFAWLWVNILSQASAWLAIRQQQKIVLVIMFLTSYASLNLKLYGCPEIQVCETSSDMSWHVSVCVPGRAIVWCLDTANKKHPRVKWTWTLLHNMNIFYLFKLSTTSST